MTISDSNKKLITYGVIAAAAVYVIYTVSKTITSISDTMKKVIPWIAGGAAVLGLVYMVIKGKKE